MHELVKFGLVLEYATQRLRKKLNMTKKKATEQQNNKTTKQQSHFDIKVKKKAINPKQG